MKYVATVEGQEYTVEIEHPHEVLVNGTPYAVDLESIDGTSFFSLLIGTRSYEVFVDRQKDVYYILIEGDRYEVLVEDERLRQLRALGGAKHEPVGEATVTAPMPGLVVAVLVEEGQPVKMGDGVVILEAMKMENEIRAPRDGVVKSVRVSPGQTVNQNEVMVQLGPPEE